jgi:hypothetical protein
METNHVPASDLARLEPDCCCPKFDPASWSEQEFHFRDKPFVRTWTHSFLHIPLDMGAMFARTWAAITQAHAEDSEFVVLSDDSHMWHGEHLFSVNHEVPGADNVRLSGDYITHVYEGPYREAVTWVGDMKERVAKRGRRMGRLFFFYTTCPKCAKKYGKNYVVGVAELGPVTN